MSAGQDFGLHPLAARDITDIWEFIAADNPLAAGRVREDLLDAIRALVSFPPDSAGIKKRAMISLGGKQ